MLTVTVALRLPRWGEGRVTSGDLVAPERDFDYALRGLSPLI